MLSLRLSYFNGKNAVLRSDNVRKIIKDHGNTKTEKSKKQVAVSKDDFLAIKDVFAEPDTISKSNTDYKNKPAVKFEKTIGDKNYTMVVVDSGGSLDIFVQTMYLPKKNGSIANVANANALRQTSETTVGTAPINNISNTEPNVNNNVEISKNAIAPIRQDGNTQYALSKEAWEAKERYVQRRNAQNAQITTLTEEQHDLLAEVASIRHNIHSSIDNTFSVEAMDNSDISKLDDINERLEAVGLPPINLPDTSFFVTSDDYDYVLTADDRAEYEELAAENGFESGFHYWMENSAYNEYYDQMSDLNSVMEQYLKDIDAEHGTQYAPTGWARFNRYSASTPNTPSDAIGDYHVSGQDVSLNKVIAPMREDVTVEETEKNIERVARMQSVISLKGDEFKKSSGTLVNDVSRLFEDIGGYVHNRRLGDVQLKRNGVKSDLAHGMSEEKAASFAALPTVIQQGEIVGYDPNWKKRGYASATIAAPIKIDGSPYMMLAVVHKNNGENKFYLHDVYTEKEAMPFITGTLNEFEGTPSGIASTISIARKIFSVKKSVEAMNDLPIGDNVQLSVSADATVDKTARNGRPIAPLPGSSATGRPIAPLPNGNEGKRKQRQWVETSTESPVVNREILPDDLDQDLIYYTPVSNAKSTGRAKALYDAHGYEKSVEYFNSKIADGRVSLDDVVLGERLISEAIQRGDKATAGELIQNVSILGTELGQKVQALSIIRRMTPEGQLKMLDKVVNRGKVKQDPAFEGVEVTDEMRDEILSVYNQDGTFDQDKLNAAVEEVKQEIADEMGITKLEKANAWRYLAMLGNPKTHNRNILSNVAMLCTGKVKNAVARTAETIGHIENRTKTWKRATDTVKEFAKQTADDMKSPAADNSGRVLFVFRKASHRGDCHINGAGTARVLGAVTLRKELRRHLREHRIGEHVLLLLHIRSSLLAQLIQLRLEGVRKAAGNRLIVAQNLLGEGGVDRRRGLAIVAVNHPAELLGHHLVALAHNDVEHRLGADNLAGRGNERRVAGILAYTRDFRQHLLQLILLTGFLELVEHIGEHTARHLIQQGVGIHAQGLRADLATADIFLAQLGEVRTHDVELIEVEAGVVLGALQRRDERLGRHMRRTDGQRAHRGVDNRRAGLNALHNGHRRQARGVMAVNINRDADRFLEAAHEVVARIGCQQTGHILDADGVGTHLLEGFGIGGIIFIIVHRAEGIADAALHVRLLLIRRTNGGLKVARVIERVENTNYINAVRHRLLHKIFHHIVRIRTIAEHILAAEQHLQLLVGHLLTHNAQALPRVFV